MKKLIYILAFLPLQLFATNYYVATNGNDNSAGTFAAPWGTWGKAFSTAQAGDTVFFRGGIYPKPSNVTDYTISHSGTSNNRIVFINYPGETPILDGSHFRPVGTVAEYNSGIYVNNRSYIDIIGLTIRNLLQANGVSANNHRGISVYNSNQIRIINCVTHNLSGYAVDVVYDGNSNGAVNYVINCDAYNIIDTLSQSGYIGGTGTGFSGGSWRSGTATDAVAYFIGCRAWRCSDQGFALSLDGSTVADSCWSWNHGYGQTGDGIGFKLGWATIETESIRRRITRCIAAYNNQYGYGTNDPSWMGYRAVPMQIYNNIAYNTNLWGFWAVKTASSDVVEAQKVFRNNISIGSGSSNFHNPDGANVTHDHNSWNTGYSVTTSDFVALPSTLAECQNILGAPRKADGSLPDIGNYFKLKSTANAIDAGIDVGLSYLGLAPDLGPFEYDPGAQQSSAKNIISFSLPQQTGTATINTGNYTVSIEVAHGTNVTNLTPTISVSAGATINPASGVTRNFTNPVTYTVTAEDETTQTWTVTVTVAGEEPGEDKWVPVVKDGEFVIKNGKFVVKYIEDGN